MENKSKEILTEKEIEAKAIKDSMAAFYANKGKTSGDPTATNPVVQPVQQNIATPSNIPPSTNFNGNNFKSQMSQETDPDLVVGWDTVTLPSKGMFYGNGISEIKVEYLTAKDEDLLTTPALLENGTVLDVLLRKKIKTPIDIDSMLTGDKNAVLLFLRASSYGHNYEVNVTNPFTGKQFKSEIDLRKLNYKEISEQPDASGLFTVKIPMRKKMVKFKLLTHKEERTLTKQAEMIKESYGNVYAEIGTLRLKSAIKQIDDRTDTDYIHRFVDAMPAGDALAIRKKYSEVEPDVDMEYDFMTPDGKPFRSTIVMGVDFFFPSL